ncbi:LysR family transcriptional regulator [Shimia sp.]|uniref:LysR family transcriptional regulator n=1 Tax=Shimia sp. TaxID=1954381 RepID=UPI003BA88925
MVELTALTYFVSAYETGSFSAAARVNGVSQPTVSAAIQKLEATLEGAVFLRERRGLSPTDLGQRLYQEASASVATLAGLPDRLKPKPRQVLRVYAQPDVLMAPYMPLFHQLRQAMPQVVLAFCDNVEEADVALVTEGCQPKGHSFSKLSEDKFGVALPKGHVLAAAESLCLEDIANEPQILRPYCPNADLMRVAPMVVSEAHARALNDLQVLDLVAAGLGVALVPLAHEAAHAAVEIRPLRVDVALTRVVGLSARKTSFAQEVAAKFVALAGG